ncbi:MAG TPA: hypothetical protein VHN38_04350 [Immundisolibacter sp.]|nr:hypothetical protein [Immundisolibacter sp.]
MHGTHAARVLAFQRGDDVVVIVPRLVLELTDAGTRWPVGAAWADTRVERPAGRSWHEVFTGRTVAGGAVSLEELLAGFPLALLECTDQCTDPGVPE